MSPLYLSRKPGIASLDQPEEACCTATGVYPLPKSWGSRPRSLDRASNRTDSSVLVLIFGGKVLKKFGL